MFLGHLVPWPPVTFEPFHRNFTKIVPGEPLRLGGELNTRAVAEYSDFGPIGRYISETVQYRS